MHLHWRFAIPGKDFSLIATDRLARQTLHYAQLDSTIVFASNADSVCAHPGIDTAINPQGIYNYVYFHMVPSPGSIYAGIHKMQAAHCLISESGNTRLHNYWQPQFQEHTRKNKDDLCEELREVLLTSVDRARTGRNAGAFLSGGLDSSSVVGMLSKKCARCAGVFDWLRRRRLR